MRLELPEPPSANRWWRMGRSGSAGAHRHMHLSAEARAYKQVVALTAGSALRPIAANGEWPIYGRTVALLLELRWFRSRRAGDLDKRIGVLLDALQGTIFATDAQLQEIHAFRAEAADGIGRVDVLVRPAAAGPSHPPTSIAVASSRCAARA